MYNNEPDLFMGEDPEFMGDLFEFDESWTVHDDDKLLGALSNGVPMGTVLLVNNDTINMDVTDGGNNQIWDMVAGDLNRTRTECETRYRQLMYITGGRSPASTRSTRSFQNVFSSFVGTAHSSSSSNRNSNVPSGGGGGSGGRMFNDHSSSSSGRSPLGLRLEEGLGQSLSNPQDRRETAPGDDNLRRSLVNNSNLRFLSGNLNTTNLSSLLSTLQTNQGSSSPMKKRRAIHAQDLHLDLNASNTQPNRSLRGLLSPAVNASRSPLNFRLPPLPADMGTLPSSPSFSAAAAAAGAAFSAASPSSRGRNVTFADGDDFVEFSDPDVIPTSQSNRSSRPNVVRRCHQDTSDQSIAPSLSVPITSISSLQGLNRSPDKQGNKRQRTHSADFNNNERSQRNNSEHSQGQISSSALVMGQQPPSMTTERRNGGRQKGSKINASSNINDSNNDNEVPLHALPPNSVRAPRNGEDGNATTSSSAACLVDAARIHDNLSRAPAPLIRARGRQRSNSSIVSSSDSRSHSINSKGTNANGRARMRSMSLEEVTAGAAALTSLGSPKQSSKATMGGANRGVRRNSR